MCQNAPATIAATMTAIRPTIVNVFTILNISSTEQAKAALAAFDSADAALANWKQGTSAQTVIQLIQAFTAAFDAVTTSVPVPIEITALVNVISAGIVTVIGLIEANAAPATPAASAEETSLHQAHVAAETQAKVQQLVPGFKLSLWDKGRAALGDHGVVASEYKKEWNKAVERAAKENPKVALAKVA